MEYLVVEQKKIGLSEVANTLADNLHEFKTFGYSHGLSGAGIYLLNYQRKYPQSNFDHEIMQIIHQNVEAIKHPNTYQGADFIKEIAEFGTFLSYISEQNLINFSFDNLLENFDTILKSRINKGISEQNLDFFTGVLSAGLYYLNRGEDHKATIREIVEAIESLSVEFSQNSRTWYTAFKPEILSKKQIYLGLPHGMAMNMLFLSKAIELGYETPQTKRILFEASNFLIQNQQNFEQNGSYFTFALGEKQGRNITLRLGYGDIGIAYALYRAGEVLENDTILDFSLEIFNILKTLRTTNETGFDDASILYGASGAALVYDKMYRKTRNIHFKETAQFWYDELPAFIGNQKNNVLGFACGYNQSKSHTNYCFMEGIAGIGMTALKRQFDDLNFDDLIWLL